MNSNTMKWLVRREFWENKGGFLWAPAITGAVATVFAIVAAIVGVVLSREHADHLDHPTKVAEFMGNVGDGAIAAGFGLTMIVLAFVVFFYALGSLYDDRRDRSILFWKSMPLSDAEMVGSKVAWALLLAPALSMAIGLVLALVLWTLAGIAGASTGIAGASAVFANSHPVKLVASIVLALPVQMAWSLPAVGWLMLCSAWSRRVPFLWATAVPIMLCAMISFTDIFPGINIAHGAVWHTLAFRPLLSVVPGTWLSTIAENSAPGQDAADAFGVLSSWQVFAHADVWIGAVVGVAMIVAAVRLRRWRDEG